jgi:Ni,Fe-hydrogenase III small subunit/formate hydrogenlyase subunit 6/NADH:ubiquinone oxidoreductase subunit I
MFKILQKTIKTGIVTTGYPDGAAEISDHFRGRPEFHFAHWLDARPAAEICPTQAIRIAGPDVSKTVTVDYGRCIFCGLCAEAAPKGAVVITNEFELAVGDRRDLIVTALCAHDGTPQRRADAESGAGGLGKQLDGRIRNVLGRSLAIREVDAGSCNGCEVEITALNNPIYDIERFGIHFVASPRHADMLLVTGPVTRNMEVPLRKTYQAVPQPRIVVAAGACGCSGGIFGKNYATLGGVDEVVPVDVYIPGCPPRPQALLYGILLAVGRLEEKLKRRAPAGPARKA